MKQIIALVVLIGVLVYALRQTEGVHYQKPEPIIVKEVHERIIEKPVIVEKVIKEPYVVEKLVERVIEKPMYVQNDNVYISPQEAQDYMDRHNQVRREAYNRHEQFKQQAYANMERRNRW
jgi:hypothetical protein